MVRAGVVSHPLEWEGSGSHELMGTFRHDPIINIDRLLCALACPAEKTSSAIGTAAR